MKSIQFGEWSFSDFAGEFELKNLPQLQSIQIGNIGNDSYNIITFHLWIEVLNWYWVFEWLDLPNLQSIINSKGGSFRWPHSVTAKDTSKYWILIVFRYSKPSKGQAIWVIPLCTILINSEYCLIDWFDSIHRCVFHSHYSYPLIQAEAISALNQHTPLNDHWIFNANIVCLKSFTSFFNHWLGSNHRLTLLHLSPQPRLV